MSVFSKLNLDGQDRIVVLHPPESLAADMAALGDRRVSIENEGLPIPAALVFVVSPSGVAREVDRLLPHLADDAVLWFAYPNQAPDSPAPQLDRTSGWEALERAGFRAGTETTLDDEWSALRFQR